MILYYIKIENNFPLLYIVLLPTLQFGPVADFFSAGKPEGQNELSGFADGDSVSDWAAEAFRWAVGEGVVAGRPGGVLDPKSAVTRAEAVQIMMKYHQRTQEG